MGKDEILYALNIMKTIPGIKSVHTFEIEGVEWLPLIGIEKRNGERFILEGFDQIFSYIENNKFRGGVIN